MKEPFERIAMEIVGPLPRSRKGNQYIYIYIYICDYATRYPEAIPCAMRLEQWQNISYNCFLRVGIPREILSDQGTNFM